MNENLPDDDLRRLIHDAASGIRPQGTLDDITNRTQEVDPMARRWFLPVIAAATVMALAIGGAVWLAQDKSPAGGTGPLGQQTPTNGVSTSARAVPIYFVGDAAQGPRLYREFQKQNVCEYDGCLLMASARAAVAGNPIDPDYQAPWPAGAFVDSAKFDGDTIVINLKGDVHGLPSGMESAAANLAVQQLIYSAQAGLNQGRVPVQLLIDGNHTDTVLGVPAAEPLSAAADDLEVLAPVQISSPVNGATVKPGDLEVTGVAAAFEANVSWELLVGGDAVVDQGHATAAECCTLSPYSFTIKNLQPGSYTLVVHDTDESGQGRPVNQDSKDIVVSETVVK